MIARLLLLLGCSLFVSVASAQSYQYRVNQTFSLTNFSCLVDTGWLPSRSAAASAAVASLNDCAPANNLSCVAWSRHGRSHSFSAPTSVGESYSTVHERLFTNMNASCEPTVFNANLPLPFTSQQVTCQAGQELQKTFFSGWSTAPQDGYMVQSTIVAPPIPYCDGTCQHGYSEAISAEVDLQPSTNQFYAAYTTHLYVKDGQSCSGVTSDPSESAPPSGGNGTGGSGTGGGAPGGDGGGDGLPSGDGGTGDGAGDVSGDGSGDGTPGGGGGGGGDPINCTGTECDGGSETGGGETGGDGTPIGGDGSGSGTGSGSSGSGTSGGGTGSGGTDEEASEGWLCDAFPSIFACQETGSAGSPSAVANTELGVSVITPRTDIGPSEASCPPPYQMGTSVGNFELAFDGACMFADGVRPVIIGMAWFIAIGGLIGFIRR